MRPTWSRVSTSSPWLLRCFCCPHCSITPFSSARWFRFGKLTTPKRPSLFGRWWTYRKQCYVEEETENSVGTRWNWNWSLKMPTLFLSSSIEVLTLLGLTRLHSTRLGLARRYSSWLGFIRLNSVLFVLDRLYSSWLRVHQLVIRIRLSVPGSQNINMRLCSL